MKTFLLLLISCLAACATPGAGSRCDAGEAYCSSPTAALACQNGMLAPYTCAGPKGCVKGSKSAVLCDQTADVAGQPCFPEYAGKGHCSADAGSTLQCLNGAWTAVACDPGKSCHLDDGGVSCR